MQDLRLIGVQDDGGHLILVSRDGDRYRLPLDEALRAAARRDRPRLGQLQIQIDGGLRPRDVQAHHIAEDFESDVRGQLSDTIVHTHLEPLDDEISINDINEK